MPFTYASHQAPVLALKLRWPAAFDGTAMVMGSMAPDWAYAFHGTGLAFDAHAGWGFLLFCTPVAVVASIVLRRVAPVLFAYVPSPPALPLRQLRVLAGRRPALPTSLLSAFLGALTHVAWDLFTHDDSWGPRHIAWLRSTAADIGGRTVNWAQVLQGVSHIGGAALAVYLLHRILTSGALLRWYGGNEDQWRPSAGRARFWALAVVGLGGGSVWAAIGEPGVPGQIIRLSLGAALGLVAASVACLESRDIGSAEHGRQLPH